MLDIYIALAKASIELAQSQKEVQLMFLENLIRDEALAGAATKR